MGQIGVGQTENKEKCVMCERTFEEDQLTLTPYEKTKTVELMCDKCIEEQSPKPVEDVELKSETIDNNSIKTETKPNDMKEAVNGTKPESIIAPSTCTCAKFPLCGAVRATQAWDEFTNTETKAYFIQTLTDYFKIDFCPFCGKRLYK